MSSKTSASFRPRVVFLNLVCASWACVSSSSAGVVAQEPGGRQSAQAASSLAAPSLVEWAIGERAQALTPARERNASEELLQAVRPLLKEEHDGLRREALLILGFSKAPEDQAQLMTASREAEAGQRERAILALGLQGGTIPSFELGRILEDREQSGRIKALAALAMGFATEDGVASTQVNLYAQELLRLGTRSHADEIAATLIGFAGDSGRNFLESFLEGRSAGGTPKEAGSGREVGSEELLVLRSAMLASFARIAATQKEVRILLTEFTNKRHPDLLVFRTAWGLHRNDGRAIDEKQRERLVQALEARMRAREPEIAGMCLLAIAKLDRQRGLTLARQVLSSRNKRSPQLQPAALLTLSRLGTAKDLESLPGLHTELEDPDSQAAWCLAIAEAHRRLAPAEWPLPAELPAGAELPEPVPALRAFAGAGGDEVTRLQRAAAVALAELGDVGATNLLLDLHAATRVEAERRQLSLALITLRTPQVRVAGETVALEGIEWRLIDALAAAGHPALWPPVLEYLGAKELPMDLRVRLLRLSHVGLAGPGRRFGARFEAQVGPGALPGILAEVAEWQSLPDPR